MEATACMLKHIVILTSTGGKLYTSEIDYTGLESPLIEPIDTEDDSYRTYTCTNCLKDFDGSESFDETKNHLGTFPLSASNSKPAHGVFSTNMERNTL